MNTEDINQSLEDLRNSASQAQAFEAQVEERLDSFKALINYSEDEDSIEFNGLSLKAGRFKMKSMPVLIEVSRSLASKCASLENFEYDEIMHVLPELCVLIDHSVNMQGVNPLELDPDTFSKCLLATIKANPSFFAQVLAKIQKLKLLQST